MDYLIDESGASGETPTDKRQCSMIIMPTETRTQNQVQKRKVENEARTHKKRN